MRSFDEVKCVSVRVNDEGTSWEEGELSEPDECLSDNSSTDMDFPLVLDGRIKAQSSLRGIRSMNTGIQRVTEILQTLARS